MENLHRSEVARFRSTLAARGAIVAEVDSELRYVVVDNPRPDFRVSAVIGKTDAQLSSSADASSLMEMKARALREGRPLAREFRFERGDGVHRFNVFAYPILEVDGSVHALLTVAFAMAQGLELAAEAICC